ncbi:hypothetical protein, partial [Terriglobus sp. ADX1]|uniref:hypothetical protein n=1 Tax=Terriglobus sp. ADX1 TaxID=2794063 RepID=UPI002FE6459E
YAAIAWYHNKVPHTGTMQDFVQKAREFTRGEYAIALDQGDMLRPLNSMQWQRSWRGSRDFLLRIASR